METPLLATKLYVPRPRPGLVARPRLVERLNQALSYPLILLSAPAGFGKTTILTQWIAGLKPPRPVAWVSLDEGDNDPIRFMDYVIAALRTLTPGIGKMASYLVRSSPPVPIQSVLTTLINDLAETKGGLVLVLDDYHLIKTKVVQEGIDFLIQHTPPEMNLLISTRVDPDLPLAGLRGRGAVFEIRAGDLRLTRSEVTLLLGKQQAPDLSVEDAGILCERTEGWAAGLKLAALSMMGQRDVHGFVAAFSASERYVIDYLMEEVLQKQPPEVSGFLLKTSVLEKLSAPLCDSVMQQSASKDMLARLESGFGGFLVPLDDTRQWYRYHHLIGEILRHQLQTTFDAEHIRQLHLRASEWYELHDYSDDAIHHCVVAQDWNRATELIASAADRLIKRGEWNTLLGWFQAVPEVVLRSHRRAYLHYANTLTTLGRLEAAETALAHLERTPDPDPRFRGQLTSARMSLAYHFGDIAQTVELAESALEQLDREDGAARAMALHLLASFDDAVAERFEKAALREAEAVRTAKEAGESWVASTAASSLASLQMARGKLRQAISTARQAIVLWPASDAPRFVLGFALYELNDLVQAAQSIRIAANISEFDAFAEHLIESRIFLAQTLVASGQVAEAEAEMAKADEALRQPTLSPIALARLSSHRVMFAIRRGDMPAALDWVSHLSKTSGLFSQHVPARLLIAQEEKNLAAEQLRHLYARATQADLQGYATRIRIYQSLAASDDQAIAFVADALKVGERIGFVRAFVDEGKLLRPLLTTAVERGISTQYASRLLSIIDAEEGRLEASTRVEPGRGVLSERELEILRLIAAGFSNRQIAARLVISLNTTKTHVRNISQKLEVSTRTRIVAKGRELNLI